MSPLAESGRATRDRLPALSDQADRADRERHLDAISEALRYIALFRGRHFVVKIPGAAIAHGCFIDVAEDIRLVAGAGIRVIVVHGAAQHLRETHGDKLSEHQNKLVINMGLSKNLTDRVRALTRLVVDQLTLRRGGNLLEAESGSSLALIRVKPAPAPQGRRNAAGEVAYISPDLRTIPPGCIPVLNPIVRSGEGDDYYIPSDVLALEVARAVKASKLIFFTDVRGVFRADRLVPELTVREARELLDDASAVTGSLRRKVLLGTTACAHGVARCHLINWREPGALLEEICTGHGSGTMIRSDDDGYHSVRPADLTDAHAIAALLSHHPIFAGEIEERTSREVAQSDIGQCLVYERDAMPRGCIILKKHEGAEGGEIQRLAVHHDYLDPAVGASLLEAAVNYARSRKWTRLSAVGVREWQWFKAAGFARARPGVLPEARRAALDPDQDPEIYTISLTVLSGGR